MQHELDVRQRLEPRAEAGLRLPDPLRDRADHGRGRGCRGAGCGRPRRSAATGGRPPRSCTCVRPPATSLERGSVEYGRESKRRRESQPRASFSRGVARIEMYTTDWCGYCVRAKESARRKGLDYDEVSVDDDPGFRARLLELTGSWTVPQIVVDDRPIGGYTELRRLELRRRARRAARGVGSLHALGEGTLARRAVPRAAAGDADLLDRRAAAVARLAGAAVDLELVLHLARGRRPAARSRAASIPAARCRARARGGCRGGAPAPRARRGSAPRAAGGSARARAPRRRRCSRRRRPSAGRGSRPSRARAAARAGPRDRAARNDGVERLGADPRVEVGVDLAGLEQQPRAEPPHVAVGDVRSVV